MKNAIAGIALLLVAGAAPVNAEDGRIADATLAAIGLGDMQVVSDAEGMNVRGMSSSAMSMGTSLIFGQLLDPATKSFVVGSDVNVAGATAENGGKNIVSQASHAQASSLALQLNVTTLTSSYAGLLGGVAGGNGIAVGF
ncbi:MAG: hypothetical protein AB7U20_08550 [Planctomycetaceae bacterium]